MDGSIILVVLYTLGAIGCTELILVGERVRPGTLLGDIEPRLRKLAIPILAVVVVALWWAVLPFSILRRLWRR